MKLNDRINKIKKELKSIRGRLFITLCAVTAMIVLFLVVVSNFVLEKFYLYNKTQAMQEVYTEINDSYNAKLTYKQIESNLKLLSIKNNLEIIIKANDTVVILTTDSYRLNNKIDLESFKELIENQGEIEHLYSGDSIDINMVKENGTKVTYIIGSARLDNGYELYMKTPTADLKESARISNNVLIIIGGAVIVISGFIALFVSRKFTEPITQLEGIAQKMSNLDFSQKYRVTDSEDEINNLGKSINTMSDKLERTINQLTANNSELEKDIERKSKIDEMRKTFISDVSHELKTPIALIQGYAEGLVENVNADDESRQFYANVILDEANKMDRLVKQLLELMKLEYGKRDFNNERFDLVPIIKGVIKKCDVMLNENNVKVYFDYADEVFVYADVFYVEQIITNYFTNAIKYSSEVNGERKIRVSIKDGSSNNKIRVCVFNSGENIKADELQRIWGRFYKIDASRNRENGGTGIGLAFVKAIMNNYKNEYGAENVEGGVEFYFELDTSDVAKN